MFEDKLSLAVLIIFAAITLIELLYYFLLFARFSFRRKRNIVSQEPIPISIVIVAQDVASVLLKTLPKLLNQQYSKFELVVVDNNSRDDTPNLLREYINQYSNIKVVTLDSAVTFIRGRKFAISMGIRCATYDHIIFTDAECSPNSVHWLSKMAQNFANTKSIVLGYSTYPKRRSLFNRLLHFDNMFNAMQYFGHALIHSAYRGDNKNMAYVRSLFNAQRGFASHNHIAYGDEDIFISRAATKNNIAIEFEPDAVTTLQRSEYHRDWLNHKEGLYYTRKFNTLKNRILLNGYDLINLLFYVTLCYGIVLTVNNKILLSIFLGVLGVRIICQYFVFGFAAKKLNEKQIIPFLFIYDIIFAILNPLYHLSARINHRKFM